MPRPVLRAKQRRRGRVLLGQERAGARRVAGPGEAESSGGKTSTAAKALRPAWKEIEKRGGGDTNVAVVSLAFSQ